ncbi:hypothetical protein OAG68_00560 [bacterium]|nr:hypothetical protein [bacterium]
MNNTTELPTLESPIKPSQSLRRHFISLGRQILRWSQKMTLDSVSIGVTCLDSRTGTSTVSFNLAAAISKIIERDVLFVEADFGKSFLSRRRGAKGPEGLSEVLTGQLDSSAAIAQLGGQDHLFALAAGKAEEKGSIELPLDNLKTVIDDQFSPFDFILFDLPIADGLSACDSLASQLDGIILVVEATDIDQRRVETFRNRMQRLGIEIIGLVINKA